MFGSLWKRIFGTKTAGSDQICEANSPAPSPIASYDPVAALRDLVRRDVAGGFFDDDAILTNANDVFEEELPRPLLRIEASAALRAALADHRAAERDWSDMTDCDRLDAAFAALEEEGIVARQNFTCCGTCGATEIWDEIEAAQDEGMVVEGYAFFHMQDTESAVEGHGLYLNYGACGEGEEAAAIAIGHRIVEQLEAQGLTTDWDGQMAQRIGVSLEWKKRRSAVLLQG
ncbi:hypothetical protein U5A82_03960 [Sphingobium sp. CR2-8]|uniref:DUF6891 domain-containing protein n=1 Tax=Sphingobium sp. CR2-8 TaxID=1306534 RepID=UPI002DB5CB3E|nr:hypothetical protein [Sphingobium sp. CR2-8]MEC3909649.1 hypothetical protein [Sphingobium sp. CR2-8]